MTVTARLRHNAVTVQAVAAVFLVIKVERRKVMVDNLNNTDTGTAMQAHTAR